MVKLKLETGDYEGEVNENKEPHGQGKMKYKNGHIYEGEFKNGNLDGKGKYSFDGVSGARTYGFNGIERFYDRNIEGFYDGEFIKNQKDGKGELTLFNKALNYQITYIGFFKNNYKDGVGEEYLFLDTDKENYKIPKKDKHDSFMKGSYLSGSIISRKYSFNDFNNFYIKNQGNKILEKTKNIFTKALLNGIEDIDKELSKKELTAQEIIKNMNNYNKLFLDNIKRNFSVPYEKMSKFSASKILDSLSDSDPNRLGIDSIMRQYGIRSSASRQRPDDPPLSDYMREQLGYSSNSSLSDYVPVRSYSDSSNQSAGALFDTTIFDETLGSQNQDKVMMDKENLRTLIDDNEIELSFINKARLFDDLPDRKRKIFRNLPDWRDSKSKNTFIINQYLLRLFGLQNTEGFGINKFLSNFTNEKYSNIFEVMTKIMNRTPVQLVEFNEKENLDEIDYGAFRLEFFNRLTEKIREVFFENIEGTDVLRLKEYSTTDFYKENRIPEEIGMYLLGLLIARILSTDNGTITRKKEMIKPFRLLLPLSMIYSIMFLGDIDNDMLLHDNIREKDLLVIPSNRDSLIFAYINDNPQDWNTIFTNEESLEYFDNYFSDFIDYDELVKLLPEIEKNKDFKDEDTMNKLHIYKKIYISSFMWYLKNVFEHKKQLILFIKGFTSIFTKKQNEKAKSKLSFEDFHFTYTPNEFSMELFKKLIKFKIKNVNESTKQIKEWFEQFIDEIDETSAKRILLFCCNQLVLPLEEYEVTVNLSVLKDRLPQAHICFNMIDLYGAENYETFKSNLLLALESTQQVVAGKQMKQCPNKRKYKSTLLKSLEAVKQKVNKKNKKIKSKKKSRKPKKNKNKQKTKIMKKKSFK